MSRLKFDYSKTSSFLSSPTWFCTIYDRQTRREYRGEGPSKSHAKDDALNTYYETRGQRQDIDTSDSDSDSSTSSGGFLISLLILFLILIFWIIRMFR